MKKIELNEALDYFNGRGLIDSFTVDDRYYLEVLIKYSTKKSIEELA